MGFKWKCINFKNSSKRSQYADISFQQSLLKTMLLDDVSSIVWPLFQASWPRFTTNMAGEHLDVLLMLLTSLNSCLDLNILFTFFAENLKQKNIHSENIIWSFLMVCDARLKRISFVKGQEDFGLMSMYNGQEMCTMRRCWQILQWINIQKVEKLPLCQRKLLKMKMKKLLKKTTSQYFYLEILPTHSCPF